MILFIFKTFFLIKIFNEIKIKGIEDMVSNHEPILLPQF